MNKKKISFHATQPELEKLFGYAHAIVNTHHTNPIMGHVLIRLEGSRLWITTTDMEMTLTASTDVVVEHEGTITVPAKLVFDMINKIPKNELISWFWEDGDASLVIKSGRSKFTLPVLPSSSFPMPEQTQPESAVPISKKDIVQLLQRTQFAMATDQIRYVLQGVYLHSVGDAIQAVGLDGFRLAVMSIQAPPMTSVIVPCKMVAEIQRILKDKEDHPLFLETSQRHIKVTYKNITLASKVIDGHYPPYQGLLTKTQNNTLFLDRQYFLEALARLSVVRTKECNILKIQIENNTMSLTAFANTSGGASEEISIDYSGVSCIFGCDGKYLMEALRVISSPQVILAFKDPQTPILIEDPEEPEYQCILMPMAV